MKLRTALALVALLSAAALPAHAADPSSNGKDARGPGRFAQRLHLTDAQKAELREKAFAQAHQAVALRAKLADARISLRELLQADKFDESAVSSQVKVVADLTGQMAAQRMERRVALLAVLTPEQRKQVLDMRGAGRIGGPNGFRGRGRGAAGHMRRGRPGGGWGWDGQDGSRDGGLGIGMLAPPGKPDLGPQPDAPAPADLADLGLDGPAVDPFGPEAPEAPGKQPHPGP